MAHSASSPASTALTRTELLTHISISFAAIVVLANTFRGDGEPLIASAALSLLAFSLSHAMIRWLGPTFIKAGFKGRDLSKPHRPEIPECMGAVCAAVYLLVVIVFIPFPFYKDIVAATSGGGNRDVVLEVESIQRGRFLHKFPHSKLASYLSAIISLQTTALLGIGDDLFDIRWRHKWWIPGLASIPILVVYFVDFGVTSIVIPIPLQPYLGELFDLGLLYYVYMACVAMFCPQSINMLAGVNGIEVAQCLVVSLLLALNDALYLLLPWIGVSAALYLHNRYPARVFVGDTYCYFSGMVFAVVGILGHFSKTLGLLLVPQLGNFLYSTPQLFGLVPCPRHRLPRFNARTGLLEPSLTPWSPDRQPSPLVAKGLLVLARLRLLHVRTESSGVANGIKVNGTARDRGSGSGSGSGSGRGSGRGENDDHTSGEASIIVETSNFTLLNLWLVWRGPMREDRLAWEITALQFSIGLFGLFARHRLALLIFKEDNWGFKTATAAAVSESAATMAGTLTETVIETVAKAAEEAAAAL